jgi:hypothetical protein
MNVAGRANLYDAIADAVCGVHLRSLSFRSGDQRDHRKGPGLKVPQSVGILFKAEYFASSVPADW